MWTIQVRRITILFREFATHCNFSDPLPFEVGGGVLVALRASKMNIAAVPNSQDRADRRRLDQTVEFVRKINRTTTTVEICDILLNLVAKFGVTNVLAGTIVTDETNNHIVSSNILLANWPHEWLLRYFERDYVNIDPTILRLKYQDRPFFWDEISGFYDKDIKSSIVMHEAKAFNLYDGFTVPLVTLEGYPAGFSFAGQHLDIPARNSGMLCLIATYAIAHALEIQNNILANPIPALTPRQIDVLRWAAEGKTDWEIGQILGVSHHAIEKYMLQARERLNASSRTHAIAKALRYDLIE